MPYIYTTGNPIQNQVIDFGNVPASFTSATNTFYQYGGCASRTGEGHMHVMFPIASSQPQCNGQWVGVRISVKLNVASTFPGGNDPIHRYSQYGTDCGETYDLSVTPIWGNGNCQFEIGFSNWFGKTTRIGESISATVHPTFAPQIYINNHP